MVEEYQDVSPDKLERTPLTPEVETTPAGTVAVLTDRRWRVLPPTASFEYEQDPVQ